jgi:hypothetical protein
MLNGLTFIKIAEASNDVNTLTADNYSNGYYEKIIPEIFNTSYLYIGFVLLKFGGKLT